MTYDANDREALIIQAQEALDSLFILGTPADGFTIVKREVWLERLDTTELTGYLTVEKDGETIEFISVDAEFYGGWWNVTSKTIAE